MSTVRIMAVDDDAAARAGLRMMLEVHPDYEVVGEADGGQAACELAAVLRPDVVLMDLTMPGMSGLEATRELLAQGMKPAIILVTVMEASMEVYRAFEAGARGFLLKSSASSLLPDAVRMVARGEEFVDPHIARRLLKEHVGRVGRVDESADSPLRMLTAREREIFDLVAQGLSNAEIAERLVLVESTVKTHVSNILRKLGLRARVEAAVLAGRLGISGNSQPFSSRVPDR